MILRRSRILGCGSYLPRQVVSNDDLARRIDTSDDWIIQRTGIRQRHVAAAGEKCSDLALAAGRAALNASELSPSDIDLVLLATTTPDQTFPATAVRVQAALGVTRGMAFDLQAVCSGFLFALAVADNFIRLGQVRNALVIGAEVYSRILDWHDRGTCVLFGDGAGAIVLGATGATPGAPDAPGVLSTHLHSDGRHHDLLFVDGGVSSTGTIGHVRMVGRDVFKHAVTCMTEAAQEALQANGMSIDDVDWLIPHQANQRILDATARKLGLPAERVVVTVDRHANTSAASVPLALDLAVRDGRIRRGHLLLLAAMGGGFSWGSALVRW